MYYDVVFISYDEPNADENWLALQEVVPYAIRVHGIKGIPNAHIEAAKKVSTTHFFCVDADNIIDPAFEFENVKNIQRDDSRVHVWRCTNAVNGLSYGYGGVKLFPTNHVEGMTEYSVDFCTSVAAAGGGFKVHKETASVTHFNSTAFNAWKSGFRECVKLSSSIIHGQKSEETMSRLKIWTSVGMDAEYGDYAIAGARMGVCLGASNRGDDQQDIDNLNMINDFDECKKHYDMFADNDIMETIDGYGDDMDSIHDIQSELFTAEQSKFIKSVMYKI